MFINYFQDFINEEINRYGPWIVHGGFNIPMEKAKRPETNKLKAVLQSYILICRCQPCRTQTLGEQIPLVLCSREVLHVVSSVDVLFEFQISDHYHLHVKTLFKPFSGRSLLHLLHQKCTLEHIEALRTEILQSQLSVKLKLRLLKIKLVNLMLF